MPLEDYKTGTVCWAKLKGFPWWPSVIMDEAILTKEVSRCKPRNGKNYPVMFFGSIDFAWLSPENLDPYEENISKYSTKPQNRKEPKFGLALKQAADPAEVERLIQSIARESEEEKLFLENAKSGSDEEMSGDESPSQQDSEDSAASGRRSSSAAKKKLARSTPAKRRESSALSRSTNGSSKKARTDEYSTSKNSRSSASSTPISRRQTGLPDKRKSSDDLGNNSDTQADSKKHSTTRDKESSKNSDEIRQKLGKSYEYFILLRRKIQRLLLKDNVPEDLSPVDELFRKVEKAPMTMELLQATKMGRLMRRILHLDILPEIDKDDFNLRTRAEEMTAKWKRLVSDNRAPSEESTTPNILPAAAVTDSKDPESLTPDVSEQSAQKNSSNDVKPKIPDPPALVGLNSESKVEPEKDQSDSNIAKDEKTHEDGVASQELICDSTKDKEPGSAPVKQENDSGKLDAEADTEIKGSIVNNQPQNESPDLPSHTSNGNESMAGSKAEPDSVPAPSTVAESLQNPPSAPEENSNSSASAVQPSEQNPNSSKAN